MVADLACVCHAVPQTVRVKATHASSIADYRYAHQCQQCGPMTEVACSAARARKQTTIKPLFCGVSAQPEANSLYRWHHAIQPYDCCFAAPIML